METAIERFRRVMRTAEKMPYRDVLKRDPCVYCSMLPMHLRFGAEGDLMTLEHIKPRVFGGVDSWRNLAPAHQRCNSHRGHAPLLVYLLYRQRYAQVFGNKKRRSRLRREFGPLRFPPTRSQGV